MNNWAYTLTSIMLGFALLGSSFAGTMPYAIADEHDDIDELKEKVADILDDSKCKKKQKYNDVCDLKRPDVDIVFPEKGDKIPTGEITISGTASDDISGVKSVQVKINKDKFKDAVLSGGNWEFTTELDPGFYVVIVKATDFVNNNGFDFTWFFVTP